MGRVKRGILWFSSKGSELISGLPKACECVEGWNELSGSSIFVDFLLFLYEKEEEFVQLTLKRVWVCKIGTVKQNS